MVIICIHTEHVDVNITPDKRKVILQQEKALLLLVKVSVIYIASPPGSYRTITHKVFTLQPNVHVVQYMHMRKKARQRYIYTQSSQSIYLPWVGSEPICMTAKLVPESERGQLGNSLCDITG